MTVGELISELQSMPSERMVVMQKDAEGNGYSPLRGADTDDVLVYLADSTWSGDVGISEVTPEYEREGYHAEDIIEDGVPCVVLFPIN